VTCDRKVNLFLFLDYLTTLYHISDFTTLNEMCKSSYLLNGEEMER